MAKVRGTFTQLMAPGLRQLFYDFFLSRNLTEEFITDLIIDTLVDPNESILTMQETLALKEVFNISYEEADRMRIECSFYL